MKAYDVIIVGAGPAGSTCADRLKATGCSIKLLDKTAFPRVKPCAGWITPPVIESLKIDLDEFRRKCTFQPITGFRTGIIGRRPIETMYQQPVSFGIRRVEFDDYLLQRSGVPCEFQSVRKIAREGRRWIVNDQFQTPLLIGAGGHFCPVARHIRSHRNSHPANPPKTKSSASNSSPITVFAQEVEFELSGEIPEGEGIRPEIPELYFCSDLQGYGWCFRKGNYLNVGLGRIEKDQLSRHVREFWKFLESKHKVHCPMPTHFPGHAYRLYVGQTPDLFDDGVMLVGDSAGLAYPFSGEGIRPAIESSILAVDVIRNCHGDYRSGALAAYESRLVERFGVARPLQTNSWLPAAWLQAIAARLMRTHWFSKNMVIDKWFLNRRQGALILPGHPAQH